MKLKYTFTSGLVACLLLAFPNHKTVELHSKALGARAAINFESGKNLSLLNPCISAIEKIGTFENGARTLDAEKLKEGTWYNTVTTEIARKSYHMVTNGDSVNSVNPKQRMQAVYRAGSFTLSSLPEIDFPAKPGNEKEQKREEWKLDFSFLGLYADNSLVPLPNAAPRISTDTSEALFSYPNDLAIQYQNTEEGTRQNFIVYAKPSANTRELRIKLGIDDKWIVNKASDDELHFALNNTEAGLTTKIIYKDLNAWDADGKKLMARIQLDEGNEFSLVVAAADATYPVTIDPLSTTASATLNGTPNSYFGIAVASAGDVNGDGFSDIIVGAQGVSANSGAAYVFTGTATGVATIPAKTLTGSTNSYFGSTVASAGDVNGDGYSDIIVGAHNYMNGTGAAYIYMGSAGGLSSTAAVALNGATAGSNFGRCVSSAGDVNADGYGDVIVGAPSYSSSTGQVFLFKGTAAGLSALPAQVLVGAANSNAFGYSLSSAGDVNGDGYSDIIVGASWVSKAFVYHGNATGLATSASTVVASPGINDSFALCVSGAGDVNRDGYSDVIVGAQGGKAAYVYNGSASGIVAAQPKVLSGSTGSNFGVCVASAGDINGDGFADVIVGASGVNTYTGAVYLYMGSAAGINATPASALTGAVSYGFFGGAIASAGDVNGDGFSDVIAGAYGVSSNSGASYIYLGSPAPIAAPYASGFSGTGGFGSNLASAGDVNADGYSDVIVAAPYGSGGLGYVYLYLGGETGLATSPVSSVTSGVAGDFFGSSLDGAGDVDGDGYADVIVGTLSKGVAYFFRGYAQGLRTYSTAIGAPVANYGLTVAGAGDINADGYADVIIGNWTNSNAMIVFGTYLGVHTGTVNYIQGPSGINFGRSVAGIGDVNGDGFADVMVGAYRQTTAETFTEKAFIYLGKSEYDEPFSVATTITSPYSDIRGFGSEIVNAGDVNGDGYDDVVLGSVGRVFIYRGGAVGVYASPSQTITGSPWNSFGSSVSAGDFNRDGYSDLVIGSSDYNQGRGAVYVFSGSPTVSFQQSALFGEDIVGFGNCVAGAGDVNGDGFSDVVIGTKTAHNLFYSYTGNGGKQMTSRLKIYKTDLTRPFAPDYNISDFGIGLFVKSVNGPVTARLVWETQPNGTAFGNSAGQIKNYTSYTSAGPWVNLSSTGAELKALVLKSAGRITRMRVRVQYKSTKLPAGQVFGPWIYLQNNLKGILRMDPRINARSPIGVEQPKTEPLAALTVYPNPATEYLKLNIGNDPDWNKVARIELIDMKGQVVYTCKKTSDGVIDVSNLALGNFIARVYFQSGQVYHSRFNVKR